MDTTGPISNEDLRGAAKDFMENLAKIGHPRLGAVVIFFDAKDGRPAIAINCDRKGAIIVMEACLEKMKRSDAEQLVVPARGGIIGGN